MFIWVVFDLFFPFSVYSGLVVIKSVHHNKSL